MFLGLFTCINPLNSHNRPIRYLFFPLLLKKIEMIFKLHKIPKLRRTRGRIPTLFFLTLISLKCPVVAPSLNVLWSLSNLGKFPYLLHWQVAKPGKMKDPGYALSRISSFWMSSEMAGNLPSSLHTDLSAIFPSLLIRKEAHFSLVCDNDHLPNCSQQRSSHSCWYFLFIPFGCLFLIT